jgi:nicotinamidase-related amidase
MEKKALLVVDLLNDFMEPTGALYCGDASRRIIPVIRRLVDNTLAARGLVIYLRDAHARDDKEFELFPPHAIKGEWGSQIISELSPAPESVMIDKTRFSAFYETSLAEILARFHPREVWVAGVCTSICIMDTVGDLRNRDYSVVVPVNAVADLDEEFHEFALRRMKRVYGARLVEFLDP